MTAAESLLIGIALGLGAVLVGLGGSLLMPQPVLLPRLAAVRTRLGRVTRTLLMMLLPLLESALLAYATSAKQPPILDGLTFVAALCLFSP